jgi:two-component system, sensor histidine kinase and response regulator
MDCNMPVMDGFEATRRILEMSPNAKIVALTAYSTEDFRSKCQEAGMIEFLTKPLNEEKLSQLLLEVGLFPTV